MAHFRSMFLSYFSNITVHTTIPSPIFNPMELEMPSVICSRPKFKQGLQNSTNIYMMFGIVSQCVTST